MRSPRSLSMAAAALGAGFALGVLPALGAASHTITSVGSSWVPNSLTIRPGDDVTISWEAAHDLKYADQPLDSTSPNNRTFPTVGTFSFECTQHSGMTGTITVAEQSTNTGTDTTGTGTTTNTTTTTTTTSTETTSTGTGTAPTNTTTTPDDSAGPVITGLKRRASRRALTISFTSDEDGTVAATIRRRNPGARAFRVVATRSAPMREGSNVVTLQRAARGLRRGAYRVTLVFSDDSSNESRTRTLAFKIG